VWALAQSRGDGHRSLVIPERVLSEYKEDLILIFLISVVLYYQQHFVFKKAKSRQVLLKTEYFIISLLQLQ